MENIILIYCSLILLIILGMLCLLLFNPDKNQKSSNSITFADKGMLVGAVLILLMVVHMNWMLILPFASQVNFVLLAICIIALCIYFIKLLLYPKSNSKGKIISIQNIDGRELRWQIYVQDSSELENTALDKTDKEHLNFYG